MSETPSKYHAIPTTIDGVRFASQREARRYQELKLLLTGGTIADLQLQPAFPLIVNGQQIGIYRGDFAYLENGTTIVEDAKGIQTPVYKLKKKLMLACHGITIREV